MKTADAIAEFGTGVALARALGISPSAVYQWGDEVPELRVYQIEAVRRALQERRSAEDICERAA